MPFIILVAGIPASGKTTYSKHIASKLSVVLIGKDAIKSVLYEALQWDNSNRAVGQAHGKAASFVMYHIADEIMKTGGNLVVESNFPPYSADVFRGLAEKHGYSAITVLCDADSAVLFKRYYEREDTNERHDGLRGLRIDLEQFTKETQPLRDFCVGRKLILDTTNLNRIDYNTIDNEILKYLEDGQ